MGEGRTLHTWRLYEPSMAWSMQIALSLTGSILPVIFYWPNDSKNWTVRPINRIDSDNGIRRNSAHIPCFLRGLSVEAGPSGAGATDRPLARNVPDGRFSRPSGGSWRGR